MIPAQAACRAQLKQTCSCPSSTLQLRPVYARSSQGRLWRSLKALPDAGEDISEAMKADLERFRSKQQLQGGSTAQQQQAAQSPESPMSGAKELLDKVLIGDFFLVLAILAWLGAGVLQSAVSGGSSPLLDAWYPLWPILWQPAIGVLMAGALVSGGLGWLKEQQQKK